MNMGHSSDFDDAVKKANGKLTDGNSFILAIDVKRARHSGIRPIPQRILHGQVWEVEEKETDIQKVPFMPLRKVSIRMIYRAMKPRP